MESLGYDKTRPSFVAKTAQVDLPKRFQGVQRVCGFRPRLADGGRSVACQLFFTVSDVIASFSDELGMVRIRAKK